MSLTEPLMAHRPNTAEQIIGLFARGLLGAILGVILLILLWPLLLGIWIGVLVLRWRLGKAARKAQRNTPSRSTASRGSGQRKWVSVTVHDPEPAEEES